MSCYALRRIEVDSHSVGATRYVVHAGYATGPNGGYTPADLWSAYGLGTASSLQAPGGPGSTQTVGIVDVFDDPNIEADLGVFSAQYGLPACTTANGCFKKVGQTGSTASLPVPAGTSGWDAETALDVEAVHAVCPNCKILLVEANSTLSTDVAAAVNMAVALGATEVTSSYGAGEVSDAPTQNAYAHPGVVMTAAAGDNNYFNWDNANLPGKANAPAAYPEEVAVGGTSLSLNADGTRSDERVWNDDTGPNQGQGGSGGTGGGCSAIFTAQPWQASAAGFSAAGCAGKRLVSDIAVIGDPITGFDIYNSYNGAGGWSTVGGTSLSSPVVAAMFALVGGAQGVANPAKTLYAGLANAPDKLYDITAGGNGYCDGAAGTCNSPYPHSDCGGTTACNAVPGFDGPGGVGAPRGLAVLSPVIAKFSMPSSATHDDLVAVDASATSSSDGSLVTGYAWDWGDGSAPTTGGPTNSHTFATAGVYTVSLIATSANGAKSVASTAKIAVDVQAPTTGGQPAISGTTTNLNTLTAVHAAWTDSPTNYTYQWRRCAANGTGCSDIPGATGPSHRLLDADVGHTLVVVETASNAVGSGTGVTSAPTAVIGAAAPPSTSLFYAAAASPFTTAPHPTDVAVNPASTLLAVTNGNDNTVSEFSIGSGGALTPVAGSPFATGGLNPTTLAYSPDGKWLAVGNSSASGGNVSSQTLTMFAVGAQGALTQAPGSPRAGTPTSSSPSGLAFSPDGKLLATADGSPTTHAIRVYSVGSDGSVAQAPGSPLRAAAVPLTVAFSPSSGLLVSALPQVNKIQEFAIAADGKPSALGSPVAVGQLPLAAVYSPGGSMLAVANANDLTYGSLSTFSVGDSGGLTATAGSPAYTIPVYNPVDLAWGPTGLLAIAGDAGEGGVYTVSSAGELTQLPQMPYEVGNHTGGDERPAIAFSGNGGLLAGIDPLHGGLRLLLQSVGTRRLTVNVSGPGHVLSVPSENAGVDCTSSCTYDFPTGKTVHLYESGSDPQQFLGWSGDCSGLGGDCNLVMTSDRTITATFKPAATTTPTPTATPSATTTPSSTSPPVTTPPTTTTQPTTTSSSGGAAAPNTRIKRLKVTAKKGTASLTFAGTGGVGKLKFLCKLDKGKAVPCGSPKTFKHLKRGRHTLTVTAVDSRGRKDASPAKKTFKV